MTTTKYKLLAKITLKDIAGFKGLSTEEVKARFLELSKESAEIAVISGEVTGYGKKATQYGESTFLTGMFLAQNRMTGEMFKSSKLYVPANAAEDIVAAFVGRNGPDDVVRFQLNIIVVPDKASAAGYTYVCQPVNTPAIIQKEAELSAVFAALPAPVKPKALENKKAS